MTRARNIDITRTKPLRAARVYPLSAWKAACSRLEADDMRLAAALDAGLWPAESRLAVNRLSLALTVQTLGYRGCATSKSAASVNAALTRLPATSTDVAATRTSLGLK